MARSSIGPPAIGGKAGDKGKAGGNWFQKHKMETYAGAGVGGILLLLYFKSHQSTPAATKGPAVFSGSSAAYDSLEAQISRLQGQHGPHGKTPAPKPGGVIKGKPPTNKKGHCPPGYFWDPDDLGGKGRCVKKAGHKGPDNGRETSAANGSLLQANRGAKSGAQPTNLVTSIEHTLQTITRPTAINSKKRRRPVVSAPIRRINKPVRKAV